MSQNAIFWSVWPFGAWGRIESEHPRGCSDPASFSALRLVAKCPGGTFCEPGYARPLASLKNKSGVPPVKQKRPPILEECGLLGTWGRIESEHPRAGDAHVCSDPSGFGALRLVAKCPLGTFCEPGYARSLGSLKNKSGGPPVKRETATQKVAVFRLIGRDGRI